MLRYIVGFICGVAFAAALPALAAAAVGDDGYMFGWEVKASNGVVCKDPWVWVRLREIECK